MGLETSNARKLDTPLYIVAFVLTLIIFAIGFFLGSFYTGNVISGIDAEVSLLSDRIQTSQLIFLLDEDDTSFCPVYIKELDTIDEQILRIGSKLEVLEESGTYNDDLKRQYFILQTESYLLSKKVNGRCNEHAKLILYFYSNKECNDCKKQGEELLKARQELIKKGDNIKTYSFDGTLGSQVVDSFIKKYKISTYPTIVFNNDLLYGYKDKDQLVLAFKN